MSNGPISLIVIDDHALIRDMLADRLGREPDLNVLAIANDAADGVARTIRHRPDVVLMDIDMPGLNCFDAARTIATRAPETRIIFLSGFFHDRYIEEALAAEASGYITKSEPPETVVGAIRDVAGGGTYFSPEVSARIVIGVNGARLATQKRSRASTLTPRELEVLRYVARGMSQKEIAHTLHLSPRTVHAHTANLMTKLDIHDRVDLARFAIREGLAEV